MPSLKIYPPARLPNSNVTETQFHMWQEELEVYLSQDPDLKLILPNKLYSSWVSYEENNDRIPELKENDRVVAGGRNARNEREITAEEALIVNDEKLDKIRTGLRTALSIVGKCVSEGHYTSVIRHSTSLEWIYSMLRSDYDIQSKGVHFFNILETRYDPTHHTPVAFYNLYRTVVSNNLAKQGEIIKYKNNEIMDNDEKFSPMLEDLVLLNAVKEIDTRLPGVIKSFYFHKMKSNERLMDFKTDILLNVPRFLEQLESNCDDNPSLCAFKQNQQKRRFNYNKKAETFRKGYCRFCHISKQPRETFLSHNFGDIVCPSLSSHDRRTFIETAKLSLVQEDCLEQDHDDEEIAELYGYNNIENTLDREINQVHCNKSIGSKNILLDRTVAARYSYIQPTPSQILTVFTDKQNKVPIHVELDSGATISFIREDIARKYNFKIVPNSQISKLGDGCTKLAAIGEIKVPFFRKAYRLVFHAVVCKQLTSDVIGGTNFLKDNAIEQDLVHNLIHMDNRRISVIPTSKTAIMPTVPLVCEPSQVKIIPPNSQLVSFKFGTLLPTQTVNLSVKSEEGALLSIEPWEQNQNCSWPPAHLQKVNNNQITLTNNTQEPIALGKDVKFVKLRPTEEATMKPQTYYKYTKNMPKVNNNQVTQQVFIPN